MPQRPKRHDVPKGHGRSRIELRLSLPQIRRVATGAQPPQPGSRTGGTGTPRHSYRCPDPLWGAAINAVHAAGLEWNAVLRGYTAAVARGEAVLYPDPLGGPTGHEDEIDDEDQP